jgi:hypothetical protein
MNALCWLPVKTTCSANSNENLADHERAGCSSERVRSVVHT